MFNSKNEFESLKKKYNDELMYYKSRSKVSTNDTSSLIIEADDNINNLSDSVDDAETSNDEPYAEKFDDYISTKSEPNQPEYAGNNVYEEHILDDLYENNISKATQQSFEAFNFNDMNLDNPLPAQSYKPIDENNNNSNLLDGIGYLKVQVFTAQKAVPIAGAHVAISFTDEHGENLIHLSETNIDGSCPIFSLPTTRAAYTQSAATKATYVTYNIRVDFDGYFTVKNLNVPIFDNETSIQPVEMIPIPENYQGDLITEYQSCGPIEY